MVAPQGFSSKMLFPIVLLVVRVNYGMKNKFVKPLNDDVQLRKFEQLYNTDFCFTVLEIESSRLVTRKLSLLIKILPSVL